jgi:hypothetical protein
MPARHTSHQDSLLLEANSKPGGSGRRKRVSARHQVKRPDRSFRRSSLFPKYGPAEEPGIALLAFFIRCGSVVRNFTGALAPRWDLTLTCSPTPSFPVPARVCPPAISVDFPGRPAGVVGTWAPPRSCLCRLLACREAWLRPSLSICQCQGKPILQAGENSRETDASVIPPLPGRGGVHVRFIASLKLLFKFYRS